MRKILFVSPYARQLDTLKETVTRLKPNIEPRVARTGERADSLCTNHRFDAIFVTPFVNNNPESTLEVVRRLRHLLGTEAKIYAVLHGNHLNRTFEIAGCTEVIPKTKFKAFLRELLDRLPS